VEVRREGAERRRRIAVVVPTLGRSPLLAACLAALERQGSTLLEIEILLVAQGGAAVPQGSWRVLAVPRNLGFAAATNLGFAAAWEAGAPELVATVNDDVIVDAGWARHLATALDATPRAAAAQGVNLLLETPPPEEGGPSSGERPTVTDGCGLAWNRWWQAVQVGRGEPPPPPDSPPREVFGVSATAALYRSTLLAPTAGEPTSGGPFDPGLGSYYEDVELACAGFPRRFAHRWRHARYPLAVDLRQSLAGARSPLG
jgi:GT2 family glycosyltransferase